MYGDLQYTTGDHYKWKGKGKVFKYKASPLWHCDYIVGFAGTAEAVVSVNWYFTNPNDFPPPKVGRGELYGLVLTAEGEIYRFNNYSKWLQVHEDYAAIGSGGMYALGALASGKTPKEAVKVAMGMDPFTGMGIKGYRV